jgi:hypothetical protein
MKGKCRRSESFLHLKRSTTPSYSTNRRRSPVFGFLLQQLLLCERNAIDLVTWLGNLSVRMDTEQARHAILYRALGLAA